MAAQLAHEIRNPLGSISGSAQVLLAELGHDIHVVTYPYGEDLPLGPAKLHRVKRGDAKRATHVGPSREKPWLDFLVLLELVRVVRREKIAIIHAHNYEGALVGIAAKFLTMRPLIYNAVNLMIDELHTYDFIKPAFLANWIARALDWFVPIFPNHIIAVTQELYQWFRQRGVPAAGHPGGAAARARFAGARRGLLVLRPRFLRPRHR